MYYELNTSPELEPNVRVPNDGNALGLNLSSYCFYKQVLRCIYIPSHVSLDNYISKQALGELRLLFW